MTVAYVSMPGTSGNYVSTPDINLLESDNAQMFQSIGDWAAGSGTSRTQINVASAWSGKGARLTASGNFQIFGPGAGGFAGDKQPCTPGERPSARFVYLSSKVGAWVFLRFTFWDAAGVTLTVNDGYSLNGVTGDVTTVFITATVDAPATTAWVTVHVGLRGTAASGDTLDVWDAMVLAHGATNPGGFVPSLRIVGDLDMRARMTATTATPAAAKTLIGQRSGNSGYAMTLGTGGELVVYHGTGSGTRAETSSGLSLVAATDTEVRSVIDISAGTWTHYKNGVQFDTSGSFATTAGSPFTGPLAVGADSAGTSGNWAGDIYYAEVRDGIDGPVVRRMDADDLIGLI